MRRAGAVLVAALLASAGLWTGSAGNAAAQVARAGTTSPRPAGRGAGSVDDAQPAARREYLQRLVLLLDGVRRTLRWVELHPGNEGLARFAAPLAQQLVLMTGHMTPPPELRLLHPHLLLITENTERALTSLAGGDPRAYRAHLRTVREEQRTLQSVLHHLQIELPEILR